MTEDRIFAVLKNGCLILLLLMVVSAAAFTTPRFTLGVTAGGVLSILNLLWLRTILVRALSMEARNAARHLQLRYLLRLGLTGIAIYVLIVPLNADVFGLLAGLSVVVLAIVVLTIYMLSSREV